VCNTEKDAPAADFKAKAQLAASELVHRLNLALWPNLLAPAIATCAIFACSNTSFSFENGSIYLLSSH
jgi:hypothetical protein